MAYNETSYKASNKYKKENIKRVPLDMQKTEYEELKVIADAMKEKVNEYIKKAIRERMERDRMTISQAGEGFNFCYPSYFLRSWEVYSSFRLDSVR